VNEKSLEAYNPLTIEPEIYAQWEREKAFRSVADSRQSYCIVIPPPNVTGALHMGHALNNSIQDVLVRYQRMRGLNALWLPGTDHAGVATQSVVERTLWEEEKKTRYDLGREKLLELIWQWKDRFGGRIIEQLKALGSSCDWDRTRFTMDPGLSRAVRFVFVSLFHEGLVYRGKRLINWCTHHRTALSNDELVYKDSPAHFWHVRYPIANDPARGIVVATTRPETMLGDTAVAVHPDDGRYADLIGKTVILPLLGRPIPVIADPLLADPERGTGAVKVTPAHDPNDYECARRNNLPFVNILSEDGTLNDNAGPYRGLTVMEARERVVEDLEKGGLLEKIEDHVHPLAHCYRCGSVIEPFLSDQWFVSMQPLVELARDTALGGQVRFFPESRLKQFLDWLDTTPDWCISRQIWWGHRIPVWYCTRCNPDIRVDAMGEPAGIPGDAAPVVPAPDEAWSDPGRCPAGGPE
jgi:valyl-tRNA synthetase